MPVIHGKGDETLVKQRKWRFAAITTGLCLAVSCQLAQIEPKLTLHTELERYLEQHFPACEMLTGEDYDSETLRLFAPSWRVTGDFDGNGEQDICLLMKGSNKGVSLLVAVHRTADGFEHFVLNRRQYRGRVRTTLDTEGPGFARVSMADDVDEQLKELFNPGILATEIETDDETLYYWEDGRYESAYRGL